MKSRDSQLSGHLVSGVILFIVILLGWSSVRIADAATVPPGFTDSLVAAGLSNPTAMALAPDGRIFVCQQGGDLRVIKNGVLLPTPFLTVTSRSFRRARLARSRIRSKFRLQSTGLHLLHRDDSNSA